MSGVDYNGTRLRKGAGDAILRWVADEGGQAPPELQPAVDRIAREGATPLAVARDSQVLGVIELRDVVKDGMRERFDQLRAMGIRTVMVTGDNRAHRREDRRGVRRRRLPRRGHARGQARADPRASRPTAGSSR